MKLRSMGNHNIPTEIKDKILDEEHVADEIGMSESNIFLFGSQVLKIQKANDEALNEYKMMSWLDGKLPIPEIHGYARNGENDFLLMSKLKGCMACDISFLKEPVLLTEMLAEGLKMLWNVDMSSCPLPLNLERKLEMAAYAVENNKVDMENTEPNTFGEDGFKNPSQLLEWLIANKPKEELVFSHGDFCLPNIFIENNKVSGFIDLGRSGIADKWQDIALCYRSLLHNYNGKYGGKPHEDFYPELIFEKLAIEPDWVKINYYILLDELF